MTTKGSLLRHLGLAFAALTLGAAPALASATIVINNIDAPGLGFNDPATAAPVGGNEGLTVGAQRLNVFRKAAEEIWGNTLNSNVVIVVQSTFQDRGFTPCNATGAVLGAAGTIQIFANFPSAEWPSTWYHSALANKLADVDLTPGGPDPGFLVDPFNDDIIAFFNPNLGQANCLATSGWYYGLDNLAPADRIDLLNVLLHELGHGLGFANFIDEDGSPTDPAGSGPLGLPDIYTVFTRDNTADKQWNQMNDRERAVSAVNTGNVVWNGPTVTTEATNVLTGRPVVVVNAPPGIAGTYEAQPASYGTPLTNAGVTGDIVLYNDGVGPDPNDACNCPFVEPPGPPDTGLCVSFAPLDTNVAGKIALINRGTCTFNLKSAIAQLAGATGVIIANNVAAGLPSMGGGNLIPPTIPSVGISQANGNLIKANLPGVNATLRLDPTFLAGADDDGHVRLYAPSPVAPGSSISHWDTVATPNLLMEPFINADLKGGTTLDLTDDQMVDIGWSNGPHCPVNRDDRATVIVGTCDSGVTNSFGPFTVFPGPSGKKNSGLVNGGCYIADVVNSCAGSPKNHGDYVSCVTATLKALVQQGVISESERDAILTCAEGASIP